MSARAAAVDEALEALAMSPRLIAMETARYEEAFAACPYRGPWPEVRGRLDPSDPTADAVLIAARVRDDAASRLRELRRVQDGGRRIASAMRAPDGPGAVSARAWELVYIEGLSWHEAAGRLGVSRATLSRRLKAAREWLAARPGLVGEVLSADAGRGRHEP